MGPRREDSAAIAKSASVLIIALGLLLPSAARPAHGRFLPAPSRTKYFLSGLFTRVAISYLGHLEK